MGRRRPPSERERAIGGIGDSPRGFADRSGTRTIELIDSNSSRGFELALRDERNSRARGDSRGDSSGPNDEDAIDIGSPKVGKFETRPNGRADNRHRDAINVHTGTVRATRSGRDVELRPLRTKSFKIIALTDCETRSIGGLLGCGLARTQRRHFMQAWNNSKRNSYFSYFSSTGINVSS